jgi:hypothetical protein
LSRLRVDRATQLGKLEKAERLLESCERSLQALSADDTPVPGRQSPTPADTAPLAAAEALPVTARVSPKRRRRSGACALPRRSKGPRRAGRAKQVLADARKEVATAPPSPRPWSAPMSTGPVPTSLPRQGSATICAAWACRPWTSRRPAAGRTRASMPTSRISPRWAPMERALKADLMGAGGVCRFSAMRGATREPVRET